MSSYTPITSDEFFALIANFFAVHGDGVWLEAPKEKNNLWLVSRMSEMDNPDRIWPHRNLGDALAKALFHLNGTQIWPPVFTEGAVFKVGRMLAKLGDSFMVSKDGNYWIFEAEKNRIHTVGEDFIETMGVFQTALEQLVGRKLYANDNCPLD